MPRSASPVRSARLRSAGRRELAGREGGAPREQRSNETAVSLRVRGSGPFDAARRRLHAFSGFMPATLLAAGIIVPTVGWLGQNWADPVLAAAGRLDVLDQLTTARFEKQGWSPAELVAPRNAGARRGEALTWLVSSSVFRLELAEGPVTGHAPSAQDVARARWSVEDEIARFPPGFIPAIGLRRVLACEGLSEAGQPISSLPNYERSLLLDVAAPVGYLRRLFHHEVFHFFDFAEDEQLRHDPEWSALNEPDFEYGAGGRSMRAPGSSRLSGQQPGFVSRYATSGVEEDKAELFAFMVTAPSQVAELMRDDPVLVRKAELLRRRLRRFEVPLGAEFWQGLHGATR